MQDKSDPGLQGKMTEHQAVTGVFVGKVVVSAFPHLTDFCVTMQEIASKQAANHTARQTNKEQIL